MMRLKENPLTRRVFMGRADVSTKETMAATHTAALVDAQQAQAANAEIVVALRRHDPEMMEQLIERYQHRLFRYLLFLVGNRDLAQDLFQETWLRVLERGSQFSGRSRFETWMFAIARNLMIDHTRKRVTLSLDEVTDPERIVLLRSRPISHRPSIIFKLESKPLALAGLFSPCIRSIVKCWFCASTRKCRWRKLPRSAARRCLP